MKMSGLKSLNARLQKLEHKTGLSGHDIERCRKEAEFFAELDDVPWSEEDIAALAAEIESERGLRTHEERLEDLL